MSSVEIQNVTKSFGSKKAVDDLSLSIPKGSLYGFIGPNGSGKTTTIRMILGIIRPESGSIRVFGQVNDSSLQKRIGYLPEERGLYKKMKVADIIRFLGQLKETPNLDDKIDYWLKRFELEDWKNKKVDMLSKGMSQKVQFICSVISDPELLILDEPFSGLDPVNLNLMQDVIIELQKKTGVTIIFSTHDMGVAEAMCDRIFMIYNGKKVLDGTLNEIQGQYGLNTLKIRLAGEERILSSEIHAKHEVRDLGNEQLIKLTETTDAHALIAEIAQIHSIERAEIIRPKLHDIFVDIAQPSQADTESIHPGENHA